LAFRYSWRKEFQKTTWIKNNSCLVFDITKSNINMRNLKFIFLGILATLSSFSNSYGTNPLDDGKALMRGIFFRDGNPDLIPYFQIKRGDIDKDFIDIQNNVFSLMEKKEPGLYDDFKVKITSGNHLIIRKALDEYSALLKNSIEEIYGDQLTSGLKRKQNNSNVRVINGSNGLMSSSPKVDASNEGTFINVTRYIAASEYIWLVNSYFEVVTIDQEVQLATSEEKELYKDELVNWIALNLKA